MAMANALQRHAGELAVVRVEHWKQGAGEGTINARDYNADVNGAILEGPARRHEAEIQAFEREQFAAAHAPAVESRGDYAQQRDRVRDVR
jgi:hypothetical protein